MDVAHQIPDKWWSEHVSSKFILSCLVHKDNKDVSAKLTTRPLGHTRIVARERRDRALVKEPAVKKDNWHVEKYGDVDHQMKKVKGEGMQPVVQKQGGCNCLSNQCDAKDERCVCEDDGSGEI